MTILPLLFGAAVLLSACQVHTYHATPVTYNHRSYVEAPPPVLHMPYRRPMVRVWDPHWRQWVYK